jgi:probable rRNA maturation factor
MVAVRVFNAHPRRRIGGAEIIRTVRRVAAAEKRTSLAVNVVFIDDPRTVRMNRDYLRHRGSTDVISFTLEQGPPLEGEVYVNLDRAREQAAFYRVTEQEEITRLVIHGTLHLLGHDDRTPALRRRMKAREDRHVGRLVPPQRGKRRV